MKKLWQITAIRQIFLPIFINSIELLIVHNCLLPINARKAFWFAITCALTFGYMVPYAMMHDLLLMAIISPYRYVVLLHCDMLGVISAIILMADSFI